MQPGPSLLLPPQVSWHPVQGSRNPGDEQAQQLPGDAASKAQTGNSRPAVSTFRTKNQQEPCFGNLGEDPGIV